MMIIDDPPWKMRRKKGKNRCRISEESGRRRRDAKLDFISDFKGVERMLCNKK